VAEADFQGRLLAGERIQWSGAPPGGILLAPGDALRIPFSVMWGGFAIFWEWGVLHAGHAPDFFVLWGIPFVLLGLYLIVGRFFVDAWIRAGTSYAVTNQRVLILRRAPNFKFTAYSIDRLPELSLEEPFSATGSDVGQSRLVKLDPFDRSEPVPVDRGCAQCLRPHPKADSEIRLVIRRIGES